jgi:hypothetical protein
MRFTISPGDPLPAKPDLDARLAETPANATIKGTFLQRLVDLVGDVSRVPLDAPPRLGRYLPFGDYPTKDFRRLLLAAARKKYPSLHISEAVRRMQRDNLAIFASSTLGSVTMSMLGSIEAALGKMPTAYGLVMSKPVLVRATPIDEGGRPAVRIFYESYLGWLDSGEIGSVEGVVQYFGATPRIEAELANHHTGTFVVRW